MFELLTSFTNRELKIRIFADTFFLLTDKNTLFSSKSTISFCLNAVNDESTLIVLKMTLAIDARYFLNRPRQRLIDSMNTIESAKFGLVRSRLACSDDANSRLDDMSFESTSNDDEFWSWWYDLTEVDLNLVESLDNSMIADSFCMLSNLNDSCHDFDWLMLLLSRKINIDEFNDKL
jgi:hypothetical protein